MPKPLKFAERLNRYPPILVRLLTVRGKGADTYVPSDEQIANACGLTIAEVLWISHSANWHAIPTALMLRFFAGCDIDLEDYATFRRLEHMRTKGMFRHLKRSPEFKTKWMPLIELWTEQTG